MQSLINDVSEKMDKSVSALRNAFNKIRTGRANPAILDHIKVDYYGNMTPINQTSNISVEEDAQSIKERKNLSANGFVEATILITPKGNIHNKPLLTFKGLPIYEKEEFQYGLEEEIEKTTKTFSMNNKKQETNLIEALKSTCRKYTKEKTGKRPLTNINLVRI